MTTGKNEQAGDAAELATYLQELAEGAQYLCADAREKLRAAAVLLGASQPGDGFAEELQALLSRHSRTIGNAFAELEEKKCMSPRPSPGSFGLTEKRANALLANCMKPEEIAGTAPEQHDRVVELLSWFGRLAEGTPVNKDWLTGHAFELAYYIASNGLNAGINLEEVKKAAFLEGLRVSPSERGVLERIGAGLSADEEPEINEATLVDLVPEPAIQHQSKPYFTLAQLHDVAWGVVARMRTRRGGVPFAFWMKGTAFPHFVCYPASHEPTDTNNFEPLYREPVAPTRPAHWYHARHLLAIAISCFAARSSEGKSSDEAAASDLLDRLTEKGGPLMWLPEQLEMRMAA